MSDPQTTPTGPTDPPRPLDYASPHESPRGFYLSRGEQFMIGLGLALLVWLIAGWVIAYDMVLGLFVLGILLGLVVAWGIVAWIRYSWPGTLVGILIFHAIPIGLIVLVGSICGLPFR